MNRMSRLLTLLIAVPLICVAIPAGALNIITITSDTDVNPQSLFELELAMSFDDLTVGGAFTLSFDPAVVELQPDGVVFAGGLGDDPTFRCPEQPETQIPCPQDPEFVSFGGQAGIDGQRLIATLHFRAIGEAGDSTLVSASLASPFSDGIGQPLAVEFSGAQVRIVPEPTVLALLLSGLTALAGSQRRSKQGGR